MGKILVVGTAFVLLWSGVAPAAAQPDGFTFHSELAQQWFQAGSYFTWTSTTADNDSRQVQVHYRTFGDRANPALVLLHGYPTSSFDFREMIRFLEDDFFIATLDFPGFVSPRSHKRGTPIYSRTMPVWSTTSSGRWSVSTSSRCSRMIGG